MFNREIVRERAGVAKTISEAFERYKSNLEITDRQEMLVGNRRQAVVQTLANDLTLHSEQPSLVIGSWDRHTLTRYLSEGDVDVDVMVILHYGKNKQWETGEGTIKALDSFRGILNRAYPERNMYRDRNFISIEFPEFKLDVVPAFRYTAQPEDYYVIPDSIRRSWVKTDPFRFSGLITSVNQKMDYTFIPLIKTVKGWNRENDWLIRSFHLECMMYHHYKTYTQKFTYPSTLRVFFEALPRYLSVPCYDPVLGDRVDSYLDNNAMTTNREIAISRANKAAAAATEAFEDQEKYLVLAIGEWKDLLGEFFPAYG